MCGIGGDAFWLIYDAKARKVSLSRRRRPRGGGGDARALRRAGRNSVPRPRPATLTTPGAVASFVRGACALRPPAARALPAGRDPLRARRLPGHARALRAGSSRRAPSWTRDPRRPRSFLPAESRRAGLRSQRRLARHAGGHRGAGPRRLLRRRGGAAGLAEARRLLHGATTSRRRARTGASRSAARYRGVTIYETPAPTQGFTVLEMLNLLEPLELREAFPRPGPRAPAGAGEADRLPRPRPLARRSALRRRADGAADFEGLCGRAPRR